MQVEFDGLVQNGVVVVASDAPLPEGLKVKVVIDGIGTLGERLKKFKGIGKELPQDLAKNHDYYLHGTDKR